MTVQLQPCKSCGHLVSPLAKMCPNCGAPDPIVPVKVKAAQQIGAIATGCITVPVIIVAVLLWLGSNSSSDAVKGLIASQEKSFTINVVCTSGTSFRGSYMIANAAGSSTHDVSGPCLDNNVPTTFTDRGTIISASVQKQQERGSLTVQIWETGGQLLNESSTRDPYGLAVVASTR